MKLLGITGAKGSGKGECARFVSEWASEHALLSVDRGFADKLKWAMARIFWPKISMEDAIEWANEFKNQEHAKVIVGANQAETLHHGGDRVITGRQLFQHGGTEMGREIFGDNFWVNQLLPIGTTGREWWMSFSDGDGPKSKHGDRFADIATISDLRFGNEAKRIKVLGGEVWQMVRPGFDPDGHASEVPMPTQYVDNTIFNGGDLDHLRDAAFESCDRFLLGGMR